MWEDLSVEQISSINRVLRQAGGPDSDPDLTGRAAAMLIRRYPPMTACQALTMIHRVRLALDL